MTEIFISYARPDEPRANRVAEALRSAGYRVWRDDELPAHRAYAQVIEERLKSAKAVVVLWSADAAKSEWVRAEADSARHLRTLVQDTDPDLDHIRDDPRFQNLMATAKKRYGLADSAKLVGADAAGND